MNRLTVLLALALLVVLPAPVPCGAAPSKDEANLQREASLLDRTASNQQGEAAVIKRLSRDFGIGSDRLEALRGTGLGYGELTIVLSLAQKMPGGVVNANVEKVTALRQGPPPLGWGEVAKQLQLKLGTAVSQVRKVNNEAHRELKTDHPAQPPQTDAGPAASGPESRRSFSGEGKDMTRGSAAQ